MSGAVRASILVVEYGSASYLEGCLRALEASELPRDHYEVIVLDNASPTPIEALRPRFPRVRWLRARRNLGFAGGATLALSRASGDIVLSVNPDCRVAPGWLPRMLAAFDRDPRVGVVGCKILCADTDVIQHAGGRLFPNGRSEHRGRGEPDHGQYDEPADVDYVTGAAFAVRRAVIERVGFLSPAYFPAYYEETELCVRARRAGFRVVYAPEARAEHEESVASGGAGSEAYLERYHRGRARFLLRNHDLRALVSVVAPAEAALWSVMPRRERGLAARAYLGALIDGWRGPRAPEPADLVDERAPAEDVERSFGGAASVSTLPCASARTREHATEHELASRDLATERG